MAYKYSEPKRNRTLKLTDTAYNWLAEFKSKSDIIEWLARLDFAKRMIKFYYEKREEKKPYKKTENRPKATCSNG